MNILNKYIGKSIISSILMVFLILLGIESFLELGNGLSDVGQGNFHLMQALINVLLVLPSDMYELFPIAALIGSLMGLGRLANQSELIVMSAAGMSHLQIIKALLQTAFILLIIISLFGEWVAPRAQHYAKKSKAMAISGGKTLATESGVWFRDGLNFIFVRDVMKNNQLSDIIRYKFDINHQLALISRARKGIYLNGGWYFQDVNESNFLGEKITSRTFRSQRWDITVDKQLMGITKISPNEMSLPKLYSYIQFRALNDLGAGPYQFAFWRRLMQPFATLVMIFLAVPFIFGPLRSVSMGLRVVTGVAVGFSFYILNQFFGPMSQVYQIPAIIAALAPPLTFALLGAFLLFFKT